LNFYESKINEKRPIVFFCKIFYYGLQSLICHGLNQSRILY